MPCHLPDHVSTKRNLHAWGIWYISFGNDIWLNIVWELRIEAYNILFPFENVNYSITRLAWVLINIYVFDIILVWWENDFILQLIRCDLLYNLPNLNNDMGLFSFHVSSNYYLVAVCVAVWFVDQWHRRQLSCVPMMYQILSSSFNKSHRRIINLRVNAPNTKSIHTFKINGAHKIRNANETIRGNETDIMWILIHLTHRISSTSWN